MVRAALASALLLLSCGYSAGLWLTVGAPLRVPEECDTLTIQVDETGGGGPLYFGRFALEAGFPQSQPLVTRGPARPVRVTATALRDGGMVTGAAGIVTLVDGDSVALDLQLPLSP